MTTPDPVQALHETLVRRDTPETVAALIASALPPPQDRKLTAELQKIIRGSGARRFGWSSMASVFRAPDRMDRQIAKARELAQLFLDNALPESDDADALDSFIARFNVLIGKQPGRASFKHDRHNRQARGALGLDISRRRYVKLFRVAARLERRLAALRREESRHRLVLLGKAALAPDLTLGDLGGHAPTAAFVAYYAARMKLRSEFTISGQQQPFDHLAAALLDLCARDTRTRWYAIAHVFPRHDVLSHLSDAEKGQLLGRWFDILNEISDRLEAAYRTTDIDLASMIVKRGNDSSTWNLLATAWNRARDHWMALIVALGLEPVFEQMLPGKVMRLMAADVAYWHRSAGGGIHPDTLVWQALPKPWEVLHGEVKCTREKVEVACAEKDVDPIKAGWTAPQSRRAVASAKPTPELVHGVTVNNPYFASLLRDMGAFSGKPPRKRFFDLLFGD
ncbi:hypothetical protein NDN01_12025 [Sphingomonas sp. QA11]|uniref:hypothetical protein n=1 Tax=Sphingomonas sp. QA11 TaxID=2950605 RepID=UPI002349FD87|nr:hypothetical protein [Sphingomonas sp. QA11]WCM29559.1 hypothetical protein NDN01_12025 [Sphingomonas sp. QA11]